MCAGRSGREQGHAPHDWLFELYMIFMLQYRFWQFRESATANNGAVEKLKRVLLTYFYHIYWARGHESSLWKDWKNKNKNEIYP